MGLSQAALRKALGKFASDPAQIPGLQEWAENLAIMERALAEQLVRQYELLGLEGAPEPPDVDERTEQLLEFVGAHFEGDLRPHYLEHHAEIENPESATPYMGLDEEEWADQRAAWVADYRQQGGELVDDLTDREIVSHHIGTRWGVSIGEFEREVVDVGMGEAYDLAVLGELKAVHGALERTNDRLEDSSITDDTKPAQSTDESGGIDT